MTTITRRHLLASLAATATVQKSFAQEAEPFPVKTSALKQVEYKYQRREMAFETAEPPGTIVVDPSGKFLYFITAPGQAIRYGVAVGKMSKNWAGEVVIKRMAKWPVWTPAPYHLQHMPSLAKWLPGGMPGGPDNPLGARAMYLYKGDVDTIDRIHGAAKVEWIGKRATAGCISLLDADIIHLYSLVQVGTRVVMLG
jgi:lipoprotein-anchoring transpeptidase ErfK/SrfK